ncbi:MAG TPA: hypothetical protein VK287_07110 [Gaiellaceae bacterium]|nr:hypothetical protein [Gaiellaceae bacterium]
MTDRLDEHKLEMLRAWGEGLASDKRDELRAAGKAILMLIEEIELLNVDLWHAREPGTEEPPSSLHVTPERWIDSLRRRGASERT